MTLCFFRGNLTLCQQKRQDVYNEAELIDGRTTLAPETYLPNCTENGEFEVLQCHGLQGACWCVDQTGKSVHGLAYDKQAVQDDGHCRRSKSCSLVSSFKSVNRYLKNLYYLFLSVERLT